MMRTPLSFTTVKEPNCYIGQEKDDLKHNVRIIDLRLLLLRLSIFET